MNVIEKIGNVFADRTRARAASYADLVARTATESIEPTEAVAILVAAGKTADALATDVALYQRRVELHEIVEKAIALDFKKAEVIEKLALANAAMKKAGQKHTAEVWPLECQLAEIADARTAAAAAEQELRRTYPADCSEELQEIHQELEAIGSQTASIGRALQEMKPRRLAASSEGDGGVVRRNKRLIEENKLRAEKAQQLTIEKDDLEKRRADLRARVDAIGKQQLAVWPA